MDPRIAARYDDTILSAARARYAISAESIRLLDGFESFIYEFDRPEGHFILRLGHNLRRTPEMIQAEVDWINYLADGGLSVSRAIPSERGRLVEEVEDGRGGRFLCTAFVKARGGPAKREQINDRLFVRYGRLLGRIHALSRSFVPVSLERTRYAWDSEANNTPDRQLGPAEARVREKHERLLAYLRTLPRGPEVYGMIHQDAHLGNVFVDEEYNLTLFDFDDCVYGHFIYDIAMVVSYVSAWGGEDPAGFTARFLPVFLSGYREQAGLEGRWLREIPYFLKLREIDLFAAILHTMGETPEDPWCARFMAGRRERIESDVPFIDLDWESIER
jgi:amicoumacin kinase